MGWSREYTQSWVNFSIQKNVHLLGRQNFENIQSLLSSGRMQIVDEITYMIGTLTGSYGLITCEHLRNIIMQVCWFHNYKVETIGVSPCHRVVSQLTLL